MNSAQCTRDGCQIDSTDKCLEGFDPVFKCPYIVTSSAFQVGSEEVVDRTAFIELPTGEALSEIEANEVARESLTRLVILAGPVGSGKTTILSCLFESFLQAPFGNFLFAGSQTLVGFERRCHDARVTSGRLVPATGHTPMSSTVELLHLRLVSAAPTAFGLQNLLLSDISGERFRALRDSTESVKEMKILSRADHLCLVIDGAQLLNSQLRHVARTDARMLLRSIVEAEVLSASCRVDVVLTKWDLVIDHVGRAEFGDFIEETKRMLEPFARKILGLSFFEIAARPESKVVPFAHGLPTLLRAWLEEPRLPLKPRLFMPKSSDGREIARFTDSIIKVQGFGDFYDIERV